MVRFTKNVGSGMSVSVEGETFIEAFEQMAMAEDCFEPNPDKNSEGEFKLQVRKSTYNKDGKEKEATYYELVDLKTKARLSLGNYDGDKKGFLFPKRKTKKDEQGKSEWLENRGWEIWKPANAATPAASESTKSSTKATSGKKTKVEEPDF